MDTRTNTPRRDRRAPQGSAAAIIACVALAAPGCVSEPPKDPDRRVISDEVQLELDQKFVRDPFADQARQAVLRERNIKEMHFEPSSARLTPIGKKDLAVLADALRTDGGSISVQRGSADATLYAARVAEVRSRLVASGIQKDRFAIDDAPAGGNGVNTSEALVIRKDIKKTPLPSATGTIIDPRAGTTGASGMTGGTP